MDLSIENPKDDFFSRSDYFQLIRELRIDFLESFERCCGQSRGTVIFVEPRDKGDDVLISERTCIVECKNCGQTFVSWFDKT
jgi:hypothetical protein